MLPERNILLSTSDEELTAFCKISFVKGTGPGGQKRNKTSSAVQIELSELDICVQDCTERSQIRNRANALKKLRIALAISQRISPAVPPENINCSVNSPAYPLFAAQLLDVLAEFAYDYRNAAKKCGISATSLLKKMYRDPQLWQHFQKMRQTAGLHKLLPPK